MTGDTVDLGTGSTTATNTGTSLMSANTNNTTGYSVAVTGATLSANAGVDTIDPMTAGGASARGTSQFGLNLMANSVATATPEAFGADVTGFAGTAAAKTGYNTANSFKFDATAANAIAGSTAPTNNNLFTVSYIANIGGVTHAGAYATTLNYTAVVND
jgi:hypothetical protein